MTDYLRVAIYRDTLFLIDFIIELVTRLLGIAFLTKQLYSDKTNNVCQIVSQINERKSVKQYK